MLVNEPVSFSAAVRTFNIKTNFGCAGVTEYSLNSVDLPTFIVLPNGQPYSFTYEDTRGFSGYTAARLKRATLRTGGYYECQYPLTGNQKISCADGTVKNLTRVISSGEQSPPQWAYTRTQIDSSTWKTTVTPPVLPYRSASDESVFTDLLFGEAALLYSSSLWLLTPRSHIFAGLIFGGRSTPTTLNSTVRSVAWNLMVSFPWKGLGWS